jgi:LmbE family N-acetylglucosaminyl deacetylase
MQRFNFDKASTRPLRVLCLGAHADDIEIGCGGSVLKLISTHRGEVEFLWVVFSSNRQRSEEALKSAHVFLKGTKKKTIIVKQFRDGFFPFQGTEIKELFEQLKQEFSPQLIFTHYRDDRHQDHRLISDLTWNTFRDHLILEYEIPKFDGDFGSPNLFVELDDRLCKKKNASILNSFPSQRKKHWFTEDIFLSVLRIRGMEAGEGIRYAEAFYGRKILF